MYFFSLCGIYSFLFWIMEFSCCFFLKKFCDYFTLMYTMQKKTAVLYLWKSCTTSSMEYPLTIFFFSRSITSLRFGFRNLNWLALMCHSLQISKERKKERRLPCNYHLTVISCKCYRQKYTNEYFFFIENNKYA